MIQKFDLIIGKANAGKTLFFLNFAAYLGLKQLNLVFHYKSGKCVQKQYTLEEAKKQLVDKVAHKTRCLQEVQLQIPAGKCKKDISLFDSSGVIEMIHPEKEIRQGMAQTLKILQDASLILHLIDLANFKANCIDQQIAQFSKLRAPYVILANKMDLAQKGALQELQKEFLDCQIIPISSLYQEGFKEVKAFVWANS